MNCAFLYSKDEDLERGDFDPAMKKVINIIYGVLISIGILLLIALQGVKIIGLSPYAVTSGSMIPMYPVGSMIYVQKADPNTIQVGDSITFYMTNTNVVATHQVYEIDRESKFFRTQGINNRDADGNIITDSDPVLFDQFIGKPIACIPWLGAISVACTKPPGAFVVVGGIITLCVILMIIEQITERKTKNEEH